MHNAPALLVILAALTLSGCLDERSAPAPAAPADPALVELGRQLFSDRSLSSTGTQSCADCHVAAQAFTDPNQDLPVSAGAEADRFGTRNAPTAAYAALIPALHPEDDDGDVLWVGGLFLDGRVDSLEAQAQQPFFAAREMNLANAAELAARLRISASRSQFEAVFGDTSLAHDADPDQVLAQTARAIAAFERTPAFAPFSSKFDAYLAGATTLSADEAEGMALFIRADKGNCAACHVLSRGPDGTPPMFTDFTYDNLGVPRHPDHNLFAADFVDAGLETTLLERGVTGPAAAALRGKFRVPTLRNVALTAPYMHNGVFTDLQTVVEFYNTRDSNPGRWAALGTTEVPHTVNRSELGNLGLTDRETALLVAFMQTLTDGYVVP